MNVCVCVCVCVRSYVQVALRSLASRSCLRAMPMSAIDPESVKRVSGQSVQIMSANDPERQTSEAISADYL
jgi:hypothetical protein